MNTRLTLLNAALQTLEEEGEAHFSTRTVCAVAQVSAPTLYHHYGSADGLLSAAIAEAFSQFLESKKSEVQSDDPVTAMREGWDDYVRFAAERPRLYAAMMARILGGAEIRTATEAWELLIERVTAISNDGRLAAPVAEAADVIWASANAASLLHVTARIRGTEAPKAQALHAIREAAMLSILKPTPKG